MIRDFIHIKNNFLSKEEADKIINIFIDHTYQDYQIGGFSYYDIENNSRLLNLEKLDFLKGRIQKELDFYLTLYPEASIPMKLKEQKFKHWKPGNSFEGWHCEVNNKINMSRILNFMIYLSSHNCGTQFFDKKIILSEIGKLVMFPSYFTHTHRGQACPDKKDRYILSGYFNLTNEGDI